MTTPSETLAQDILTKEGWNPKKINGNLHRSGYPDFRCSNDRYVEVKKIGKGNYIIQIQYDQLLKWDELLDDGYKIFLMVISHKLELLTFFEIKKGELNDGSKGSS